MLNTTKQTKMRDYSDCVLRMNAAGRIMCFGVNEAYCRTQPDKECRFYKPKKPGEVPMAERKCGICAKCDGNVCMVQDKRVKQTMRCDCFKFVPEKEYVPGDRRCGKCIWRDSLTCTVQNKTISAIKICDCGKFAPIEE